MDFESLVGMLRKLRDKNFTGQLEINYHRGTAGKVMEKKQMKSDSAN